MQTLAIAGATGNLGQHLMKVLLSPQVRSRFRDVIVLSRAESDVTREWSRQGATIALWTEDNIKQILSAVGILVNLVGPQGHHLKELILEALPSSQIKLYFPSEFGVDHTLHDFSNEEWDYKRDHTLKARTSAPNIKICQVFPGLFLERAIGPWMGFYTAQNKYTAIGSQDTRSSYTSMEDVGRAVVELALLDPAQIPDVVKLTGDNKSMREIAQIMTESGSPKIQVEEVDLTTFKERVIREKAPVNEYIEFIMGQGYIDFSEQGQGNDNHLINQGEAKWKWKTMHDHSAETNGRPWHFVEWKSGDRPQKT
ncbi:Hypothetical protein D9617_4g002440 [Elsinoe fawcettii]|nr:Hypothetical protein D9617_4g002440 [Elsinoe fawcettii]